MNARILAIRLLASCTTLVAVAMSAVSASDRGGTAADTTLLIALSALVCVGTHLLLALSWRRIVWLLWSGCLTLALFQHMTFFTHAGLRAGQARAEVSTQVADIAQQMEALNADLASIKARSVTEIAIELAATRTPELRRALRAELSEAQRAAHLRDELVTVSATATYTRVTESSDPVTTRLAAVTGVDGDSVSLAIALVFAVILELTGALLWFEALRPAVENPEANAVQPLASEPVPVAHQSPPVTEVMAEASTPADMEPGNAPAPVSEIRQLQQAVASGLCKPTVAGIRAFRGCGQARALELRRELAGSGA